MSPILPLLTLMLTASPAQPDPKPQTSADRREDKTWQITAGLDGAPITGPSLQAAYFLDADRLLTASFRGGTDLWRQVGSLTTGNATTVYTSAVGYKSFFNRSVVYFEGSLFHQTLKRDSYIDAATYDLPDIKQAELRIDRFGGLLTLGSQWQKSHFTIGCDWVGYAVPLLVGSLQEKRKITAIEAEELDEARDDLKHQGSASGLLALRFYLGFSF